MTLKIQDMQDSYSKNFPWFVLSKGFRFSFTNHSCKRASITLERLILYLSREYFMESSHVFLSISRLRVTSSFGFNTLSYEASRSSLKLL